MDSSGSVLCEVVIPIHNALGQTSRCIESVLRYSTRPFRLVLVNDGSDEATTAYVTAAAETPLAHTACVGIDLLHNERNLGFLHTANRGLAQGGYASKFKIILNSDTVVSPGWLEAFDRCFGSDERIGLATPVSNNAENLSIAIPQGESWLSLAEKLSASRTDGYPDVATAIGFCMGIRSAALQQVGAFDEVFAPGYAEDSDLHYRFLSQGFRSVLVPDCFIYHESHASFSVNKERLVKRNRPLFDQRWKTIYTNDLAHHDSMRPLASVEAAVRDGLSKPRVHDVLFVIATTKLFGGIIVVYELVNRLLARGIDAGIIVLDKPSEIGMQLLFTPYFRPDSTWNDDPPASKVYVATHFETCAYVTEAVSRHPSAKAMYLIQGYEGWFPGASIEEVVHTYKAIPNRVCVSSWLKEMIARWDCPATAIGNGVDTKFFYPAAVPTTDVREETRPFTVITMLREDPQGGWKFSANVLRRFKELHPDIRLIGVGNLVRHGEVAGLLTEAHEHADRKQMRVLYSRSDAFLDCSMVQGFGLMGLEAMASGLAVVTGATGGVTEYATAENAIVVPLGDETGFVDALLRLRSDRALRARLSYEGYRTAQKFDWERIADTYAEYVRWCMREGEEISSANAMEMNRYLFKRLVRSQETARQLTDASETLSRELRTAAMPAGAYETVRRAGKGDLTTTLGSTFPGVALTRVYEEARAVVHRLRVDATEGRAISIALPVDPNSVTRTAIDALPREC